MLICQEDVGEAMCQAERKNITQRGTKEHTCLPQRINDGRRGVTQRKTLSRGPLIERNLKDEPVGGIGEMWITLNEEKQGREAGRPWESGDRREKRDQVSGILMVILVPTFTALWMTKEPP